MSNLVVPMYVRRGAAADRPTLSEGEFRLDTDSGDEALYLGTGSGNKQVPFIDQIATASDYKFQVVPWGNGMQTSAGAPTQTTLQVNCAPFFLSHPITVGSVAVEVTSLQTSSIDIAIFSWDKATRSLHLGWNSLASGVNTYTLSASVALTVGSYVLAVSIKRSGASPNLAYAYANQTVDGLAYLMNAATARLGINASNADATTGIPSSLGAITMGITNAIPLVALISA